MRRQNPHTHRGQLSDDVASYLRQAIMAGEFTPGDSVRAEHVGALLDVSATPVREALHTLRAEGFLDLTPRRGFAVAPLVGDDIRDIFEAHALIAGELTARATAKVDPSDIDELQQVHDHLMRAADRGDTELLEKLNHEFHRCVYNLGNSERLRWALSNFVKYVPRAFYGQIEGWPATTLADHAKVLEAIAGGDPAAARTAMSEHIRTSGEKLAEHFERRQSHSP